MYQFRKLIALKRLLVAIIAIIFVFFIIPKDVQAQRAKVVNMPKYDYEPYHFGFILAFNEMQYSLRLNTDYQNVIHDQSEWPDGRLNGDFNVYSVTAVSTPGFTVGIVGNLRLGKYFDLRFIPSLSFGERKLDYVFVSLSDIDSTQYKVRKSLFSTFVEFPLHIKYRSKRLNNMAAYLLGGANFKIDLASQKKNEKDITNAQGEIITIVDNIRTNKTDLALEIGVGFDFYTPFFKFGTELKMSYGIMNILNKDNLIYSTSIDHIRNKVFQLTFTFE